MDNQLHYCGVHQTKFYRNEKIDANSGESKVWFSHRIKNGSGYCNEKALSSYGQPTLLPLDEKPLSNTSKAMYACNAMNNAVSLAASGKIEVSEIGKEFKRFFADLQAL